MVEKEIGVLNQNYKEVKAKLIEIKNIMFSYRKLS